MKKILILFSILFIANIYAQPKLDLVSYQKMYMKSATGTNDTISVSDYAYYKFSIAPTETDSIVQFALWSASQTGFSASDSASITQPMVFNQPDWLDADIYKKIIIKGHSDYILIIWGRKK